MQIKTLTFLAFLFIVCALSAQTYDISQYKARFERRPFLELNPSFSYNGILTNKFSGDQHR